MSAGCRSFAGAHLERPSSLLFPIDRGAMAWVCIHLVSLLGTQNRNLIGVGFGGLLNNAIIT